MKHSTSQSYLHSNNFAYLVKLLLQFCVILFFCVSLFLGPIHKTFTVALVLIWMGATMLCSESPIGHCSWFSILVHNSIFPQNIVILWEHSPTLQQTAYFLSHTGSWSYMPGPSSKPAWSQTGTSERQINQVIVLIYKNLNYQLFTGVFKSKILLVYKIFVCPYESMTIKLIIFHIWIFQGSPMWWALEKKLT